MDWKLISVIFSVFQFVFMAVIFSVIKFNDLKHIDEDLRDLKKEFHKSELSNSDRHIEALKATSDLSVVVARLAGQLEK